MGERVPGPAPPCLPSLALIPASPRTKTSVWGPEGHQPEGDRDPSKALTSLQLGHPLQQRVQGTLGLLPVSRGLVVELGLLILQLCDLAQQLPLQLPQPPLKHLSKVAGQRGIRHVHTELVLWVGADTREKD